VTQGLGYTNATTSLIAARFRRTPLLLLAGHAFLRDPYNPQAIVDQHALGKLTTEATVRLESANKALAVEHGPVVVNVRINGDFELPVSWEIATHLS
jgi:thiamine pyrophosphate-dependent acetolactate synthase large subunit-like protein